MGDHSSVFARAGFLKGFLFAAVFVAMVVSFVPVRYEANDDFGLIARFSRESGFKPDPLQPHVSWSLGAVLCPLYRWHPKVPWYGLFIYTAAFWGMSLILSVLFRSTRGASMWLALPLLGILFFHVFSFGSFTSASLLLECGVFLSVMEWVVRGECPAKHPRFYAGTLALGFLAAFVLRWMMVLFASAFGAPVLLFVRKRQLGKAIPLLMVLGLAMAGDRALFHLMISDEHKAFLEYNALRARFNDTVRGDDHGPLTRRALQKAGWSLEDYVFYKSWVLYDNREFNTETLRTFLRENDPKKEESVFQLGLKGLRRQFRIGNHYALALVFATVSILVYRFDDWWRYARRMQLRILLTLAVIAFGILYVMCFRFVPRVFVPLSAYFFGTCFMFSHLKSDPQPESRNRPVFKKVLLLCAILFCLLTWGQAYAQGRKVARILKQSEAEKAYIQHGLSWVRNREATTDPLLVLMDPVGGLGAEYVHPLKEYSDFTDLRVFPGGWGAHSPRFYSILRDMGLPDGRAFLEWMIDNPRALLVLRTKGRMYTLRWESLWESYYARRIAPGKSVRLVPVYDFRNGNGAGLVLFRMRSAG